MLKIMTIGTAFCIAALVGCNKSEPGGPGATDSGKNTGLTSDSNTFTIKAPVTSTSITQGAGKDVKIEISRKKDFKQPVTLTFSGGNKVNFDPKEVVDEPSQSGSSVVKVSADPDAPLGKQTITVKATPESGAATSAHFDIDIKEKGK